MRSGIITLLLLITSSLAFATVTVEKVDFFRKGSQGKLEINFSGNFTDYPELEVIKNSITVSIPNAIVLKEEDRRVNFSNNNEDTIIRSFAANNLATIKTSVPFNIEKLKQKVSLTIKDNKIILSFPRVKVAENKQLKQVQDKVVQAIPSKKDQLKITNEILDENFLNQLEKEQNKPIKKDTFFSKGKKIEDKVSTSLSSTKKNFIEEKKSNFSLIEYGGKFVAFLGLVLLLFYGIVTLMKKGFIKKGQLGFLNKTEQVQVLSQTYIAPKKSLMLIRAHNQVFLVSNTESGIHPISEINDVAGLIKQGEKIIAGNNFDDSLFSANEDEKVEEKVKLKEDIAKSNQDSALSSYKEVKERVKFSDQLKKKVKNLKPLQ